MIVILTSFIENVKSQELDYKLLDKQTKISLVSIDQYMVEGYIFERKVKNGKKLMQESLMMTLIMQ